MVLPLVTAGFYTGRINYFSSEYPSRRLVRKTATAAWSIQSFQAFFWLKAKLTNTGPREHRCWNPRQQLRVPLSRRPHGGHLTQSSSPPGADWQTPLSRQGPGEGLGHRSPQDHGLPTGGPQQTRSHQRRTPNEACRTGHGALSSGLAAPVQPPPGPPPWQRGPQNPSQTL